MNETLGNVDRALFKSRFVDFEPLRAEMEGLGSGIRFANGDTLIASITPCLENGKAAYVDFLPEGETGWGSTEYILESVT